MILFGEDDFKAPVKPYIIYVAAEQILQKEFLCKLDIRNTVLN